VLKTPTDLGDDGLFNEGVMVRQVTSFNIGAGGICGGNPTLHFRFDAALAGFVAAGKT
jgi:hypothetical protein